MVAVRTCAPAAIPRPWTGFLLLAAVAVCLAGMSTQAAGGTTYTIRGRIVCGLFGFGIPGTTLRGLPGSPETDDDGYYSATVEAGWTGGAFPQESGLHFDPPFRNYTNVTSDRVDNYKTTLPETMISGRVRTEGGAGVAGVRLVGLPGTPQTGADGFYTAAVSDGFSRTVTPQKTGYVFTPPSRTYSDVGSDKSNQDYTAGPAPDPPEVTPSDGTDFGEVVVGDVSVIDDAYTVTNADPDDPVDVTVSVDAPFQVIVDGGLPAQSAAFTLGVGEAKAIGLQFAPFAGGNAAKPVAFNAASIVQTRQATGVGVKPVVVIWASDPLAGEPGADEGEFTVGRSGGLASPLTVKYSISGTARNGTDYAALASQVTLPAGEATVAIAVQPLDDLLCEGSETATLKLLSGSAYAVDPNLSSDTVTIADDEPMVGIAATQPEASEEGPTPAVFTISRTGALDDPLIVRYSVSGTAGNGTDYPKLLGEAAVPAGEATVDIEVLPINDPWCEREETVTLKLKSSSAYSIDPAQPSATATIADDEPTVSIAATQPDASEEGPVDGEFTITRSRALDVPLTVRYSVSGKAKNGSDYERLTGEVTIPDGEASVTVPVLVINDPWCESDETVTLKLKSSKTYYIDALQPSATVTIADDEPTVSIAATQPDASEQGPVDGEFTITRSRAFDVPLTVRCSVSGKAKNGSDYERLTGEATIPEGEASVTVPVLVINDPWCESDETVTLKLKSSKTYYIDALQPSATVTITDDEPTVGIAAVSPGVSEAGPAMEFTFTRSRAFDVPLTVRYSVGGTATNGTDYPKLSGEVTIPEGEASATIQVLPTDDAKTERDETVILKLRSSKTYYIDAAQACATITIADNDPAVKPTIGISATVPQAPEEGPGGAEFTIARLDGPDTEVKLSLAIGGMASNGRDYLRLPTSVTLPQGEDAVTIAVTPRDDTRRERDETVVLTLKASYACSIDPTQQRAEVAILDND